MIRQELDDVRFSKDQADLAELWMLFGDWRYRTKDQNRIMLSDFFPPIESIQYLIDQKGLIVMKIEVYQKTVRDAGKRGYMSGQAERPKEESREAPAPSEITTAILDRWKAEEDRDEWKRKHRMVSDDYSAECHENAKLRANVETLNKTILHLTSMNNETTKEGAV